MPTETAELVFSSDEAKTQALEALQEKMDTDPTISAEEMDKIFNATIEGQPPEVEEVEIESNEGDAVEPPVVETPETPVVTTEESKEKSNIDLLLEGFRGMKPEDIPTETYYDPATGRTRPYITHKSAQDLFKSYLNAQKRIRYLETERLAEEHNAGFQKAEKEYKAKLAELQQKVSAAPASQMSPTEKGKTEDVLSIMKKIEEIDPESDDYDPIQETQYLKKGLAAAIAELSEIKSTSNKSVEEFKNLQAQEVERQRAEQEQRKKIAVEQNALMEVDAFANSPEGKQLGLSGTESFQEMIRTVKPFEDEVAASFYGKSVNELSNADVFNAMAQYHAKNPNLMTTLAARGVQEPACLARYTMLDDIERTKNGWVRNPVTKQYERRHREDGQPVSFPDMHSSWLFLADKVGYRKDELLNAKREAGRQALQAATKRDQGITSMDTSAQIPGQNEPGLSQAEATKILNDLEQETAISEAYKGNLDPIKLLNAALVALGDPPMDLSEFVTRAK